MSIRLKLTLIYNGILALTLIIFGVALYTVQSNATYRSIKTDLRVSADTLSKSILNSPSSGIPSFDPSNQPNPPPEQNKSELFPSSTKIPSISTPGTPQQDASEEAGPMSFENFSGDQAFNKLHEREIVRVLDASGALVASPLGRGEDPLPLSDEGLTSVQSHQEWWSTEDLDGQELLVYNRGVEENGELIYIIQVARPLHERDTSLHALRNTLFLASLIAVILAFGIGWLISGITLRPIHKITQTAQAIGKERDFSKRVSYKGPQDEIGTLARTFNLMLSRLESTYQQLARSLEMQQNFVADVSHELRTPLTTLRGNLGLLRRDPPIPPEEQADILGDMVDESDRLIRLVNNLLALASADSGRNMKKERISVSELLEETHHQALQMEQTRRILYVPSENSAIIADKDALKQILIIGIDNAIKHTDGDISMYSLVEEDKIKIIIQDSGKGLSSDQIEHLFDRFFRGEEPSASGFGLGLPIAKALTEGMGGSIVFKSEENIGSQLIITFDRTD